MQTDTTSANNSQHCCVLLANNVASVCMGLKVWPVSNYTQQVPTSADIVEVPCKRTQHVGPNNVGCCWPRMLRPFAWAFIIFSVIIQIWITSENSKIQDGGHNLKVFQESAIALTTRVPKLSGPFILPSWTQVETNEITVLQKWTHRIV